MRRSGKGGEVDRNEIIRSWMESAEDDLAVAEHLLLSGDHLWCLFVAHLVVEKALQEAVVSLSQGHAPPIHNLVLICGVVGPERRTPEIRSSTDAKALSGDR